MHPSKGKGVAHSREVGTHVVEAEQGRTWVWHVSCTATENVAFIVKAERSC